MKPTTCQGCPGYEWPGKFIRPEGSGANRILLVGEAGGEEESRTGTPFVPTARAGGQLLSIIRRAGYERDNFKIHNVLSCRPPNNKLLGMDYMDAVISHCSPNLDKTIEACQPKVIVALGEVAMQRLTGNSGITRYRGFPAFNDQHQVWVIPTFHPSYLLPRKGEESSSKFVPVVIDDLRKAHRLSKGFSRMPTTYLVDKSPERLNDFIMEFKNQKNPLAWDIETKGKIKLGGDEAVLSPDDSPILRVGFSFRPGYAISVPWEPRYMMPIKYILEETSHLPKIGWNSRGFDEQVVARYGIYPTGILYDTIDMWHILQPNLPRGLEFVSSMFCDHMTPWKHTMKSEFGRYNCKDCDANITIHLKVEEALRGIEI